MNGIRDNKSLGLPSTRTPMSAAGWNFCLGMVAVIALLTAYGLTTDTPERRVVTVTLPKVELERIVAQARIDAAREAFTAARADGECFLGWKANPGTKPQGRM